MNPVICRLSSELFKMFFCSCSNGFQSMVCAFYKDKKQHFGCVFCTVIYIKSFPTYYYHHIALFYFNRSDVLGNISTFKLIITLKRTISKINVSYLASQNNIPILCKSSRPIFSDNRFSETAFHKMTHIPILKWSAFLCIYT